MSSKLHWIKSRLISGIEISPKDHRITVNFKTLHDDCQTTRLSVQKHNLVKLQKLVMNDLQNNIHSNTSVLVREGISYFLDVDCCAVEMEIDEQVRPELSRLVYNFEMMVHPSATKLMHILLDTVNDIIEPYINDTETTNEKLSENLQRFIKEIRAEILDNRRCHLGLRRLIEDFDGLFHNKKISIRDLKERVDTKLEELENERKAVRLSAQKYFRIMNPNKDQGKINKYAINVNSALDERNRPHSKTSLSECLVKTVPDENYVNILVYGLSELVVKSICGFRDSILKTLMQNGSLMEKIQFHKDNIEGIASTQIRIFVCEGQPKTITARNDRLTYHDGTKYALELNRRGFNNIMIVPDLVAGSLLSEDFTEAGCFIDYVMLGMNGLEYVPEENPLEAHFLHSSGHSAIAVLTRCMKTSGVGMPRKPRLILVLSHSKCDKGHDNYAEHCKSSGVNQQNTIVSEGFIFWSRKDSKSIRTQPFLIRDEDVRAELFDAGICLYCCFQQ